MGGFFPALAKTAFTAAACNIVRNRWPQTGDWLAFASYANFLFLEPLAEYRLASSPPKRWMKKVRGRTFAPLFKNQYFWEILEAVEDHYPRLYFALVKWT